MHPIEWKANRTDVSKLSAPSQHEKSIKKFRECSIMGGGGGGVGWGMGSDILTGELPNIILHRRWLN